MDAEGTTPETPLARRRALSRKLLALRMATVVLHAGQGPALALDGRWLDRLVPLSDDHEKGHALLLGGVQTMVRELLGHAGNPPDAIIEAMGDLDMETVIGWLDPSYQPPREP